MCTGSNKKHNLMDKEELNRFQDNGVFSGPETGSTPSIPLGILLSSCHLWNAQKVCNFLITCWDNMKEREHDDEMNALQEHLRSQSEDVIPLDEEEEPDWTKVLGNHWRDILKIRQIVNGDASSKSVVQLLRFIRNKLSHPPKRLRDEEKIELGWFPIKDLDKTAYVTYWVLKFPKLIPFLWLKLYQSIIHSQLTDYYPCLLEHTHINYMSHLQLDLDIFMEKLHDALREHLEEGELVERFHNADSVPALTLEFRTLPYDVIRTVLDGKSSVILHVRQGCVRITWYKTDNSSDSRLEYTLQIPKSNPFRENTTLIFVNTVQDRFLVEECGTSSHVIFFFSKNGNCIAEVDSIAGKFSKLYEVNLTTDPLKWMEFMGKPKLKIEEGEVNFQDNITKIKDILPQGNSEDMFSMLHGNALINALLVGERPIVYGKHKLPTISNTYIPRQLVRTCMVTSKVLRHRKSDIFIITNIKRELLEEDANPGEKMKPIKHIDDFMSERGDLNVKIYFTSDSDSNNLRNILKELYSSPEKDESKGIHFLRYDKDDLYEWLGTFGPHSIIKESFAKIPDNALHEQTFLQKIVDEEIELIFIADKPGMGKSLLLASLSNRISTMFQERFVLHLQMKDVVEQISKINTEKCKEKNSKNNKRKCGKQQASKMNNENCLKKQIESFILDALCTTNFERCVVEYWLQRPKVTSTNIKFELMLDGLDEVNKKYKDLALDILKVIHREFSSIRLWVTLREHMIDDLEKRFSVIVYKILPFSEDVQIDFLKDHWGKTQTESVYSPEELYQKAKNCVTGLSRGIETEIAGAPLQCRMLAEIYEDKLDEVPDGENIHFILTQMYEDMIEKKLRECLKEKQGWHRNQFHGNYMSVIRETMQFNHMYLAIKLLFSDSTSDSFRVPLRITSQKTEDMENTVKDEGIIQNVKPLAFIHRTFAEYFAALFIFRVLSGNILALDANNVVFQNFFINEALDVSRSKQQLSEGKFIPKFKFPVLCYFLNAMLDDEDITSTEIEIMITTKAHDFQENRFETQKSVVLATLQGSYFNIAKLIIGSLSKPNVNIFMERTGDMPEFLLEASLRCTDVDFFNYISSTIEAWYDSSHDDVYKIPENIFKLALGKGKYEIAKTLVEEKGYGLEAWAILRENDKKKQGIYHRILVNSRHDEDKVLTEKKKLLQYVFDIDPSLLDQTDTEGETPLFMPPNVHFSLKKFLITDLHANVNVIGKHKNTPFHWMDYASYKKSLTPEVYHEMLETFLLAGFNQINLFNQVGCTPLHCAIKTFKHYLQEKTLELFRKENADFNAKDKNGKGSTVLHFCIHNKCSIAFIKKLIDCGSDIYVRNLEGLCALQLAQKKKYKALEEMLITNYKAADIA